MKTSLNLILILLFCLITILIFMHAQKPHHQIKLVQHNSLILWTQSFGNPQHPACLLISGAGAPAMFYTDHFCKNLVQAGYFVIRFDHRDIGLSSAVNFEINPYTAFDLADDAIAILDAYNIKKTFVVGHSMGGLVAQILAINHKNRLLGMVSMSVSTVGVENVNIPSQDLMDVLLENKPTQNFKNDLPGFMKSWAILQGKISLDIDMASNYTKDLYERSHHKVDVAWSHIKAQQNLDIQTSNIDIPTLLIHGELDPLIPLEGAIATSQLIKDSSIQIVPNMGHMIFNKNLENEISQYIIDFFKSIIS